MKDSPKLKPLNKTIIFLFIISLIFSACSDSPEKMRENADKYFTQAVDYFERGYYKNARSLFLDVIDIEEDLRLTDMTGDSYLYLGLIAFDNSNYTASLNRYKSAREIFKKKFDRKKEGLSENNIGSVYSSLGQYEEALESYGRALGIAQLSADKEGEGIAQINMGSLFAEQGNYQQAFNHFQKAFDAYNVLGDVGGQLDASIRIGESYLKFGSYSDALTTFNYALERAEDYALKQKVVRLMNNIGLTYFQLKNYQEALNAFEYGLEQIKSEEDNPIYGWTINNNLGDTYKNLFLYPEAIAHYEKAVELSNEYGEGLNSALINLKIAEVHLEAADDGTDAEYGKAAEMFEKLLDLFEEADYNYGRQQAFAGLTKVYSSKNNLEQSYEYLNKAQNIFNKEIPIGKNRLTENFALLPDIFSPADVYSVFSGLKKNTELIEFSLRNDTYNSIRFLNSLNFISLKDSLKGEQLNDIRNLEKQIQFLQFEIANEKAKFNGYENSEKLENLKDLLKEKLDQKKNNSFSILKDYYHFNTNITVNDIQKKLDGNTGFLSILCEDENILITLISKEKITHKVSQFSGDALNGQLASLIKSIAKNDSAAGSPVLRGIYVKTLKLIESDLKKFSSIIVYLSGGENSQINYLPVHALIDDDGNYFANGKTIKYFGGFSGPDKFETNKRSAVVSVTKAVFASVKNAINVEKFSTSSSVKNEIINYNPGGLFFYSPVYFSSQQPTSSYFECFSDSASSPELNLRIGEMLNFNLNNAAIFNFLTDKGSSAKTFNLLMPVKVSVIINHFNISGDDRLNYAAQIINQSVQSGNSNLNSLYGSQGLSCASLFQYVKL